MGDSSCLLHGFSYASAVPNHSKQGNHMHALGESISLGRLESSVSWDRWSAFSHKKYVEEAERYAQPGSVAQKKAFFEAHYKRIAAQKAAAALLDQEIAAAKPLNQLETHHHHHHVHVTDRITNSNNANNANGEAETETTEQVSSLKLHVASPATNVVKNIHNAIANAKGGNVTARERRRRRISNGERDSEQVSTLKSSSSSVKRVERHNAVSVSVSENSETSSSQIEKPLLKQNNSVDSEEVSSVMRKRRGALSSVKTPTPSSHHKTRRTPPSTPPPPPPRLNTENHSTRKPAMDGKRSSPKSLRSLMSLGSYREPDKEAMMLNKAKRSESSFVAHTSSTTPKDCPKTPAPVIKTVPSSSYTAGAATPQSLNTRIKTADQDQHPSASASGRKTCAPKWHLLSAVCSKSLSAYRNKVQSPTVSSPFVLRTEERAARRKQKLEEKFNATEKTQQKTTTATTLKEKAGNEFRKLRCSLCFKPGPLPDLYKEREPQPQPPQPPQPSPPPPNKKHGHGTISMPMPMPMPTPTPTPMPPPPPRSLANTNNFSNKKLVNQTKFLTTSLPHPHHNTMPHENASPNIHHY